MKFSAKAVNDSFKRLSENINKDNTFNKRLTEARMNYAQAKEEFCDLFFNQNKDPFYEEDGSGDYIMNLMWKVESKNGIEVETSMQGRAGSLDIYKNNHLKAQGVDYDDYLERVAEIVQESKTPKVFMNSWLSQLESLMDDDRYLPYIEDEEDYEDEEDIKDHKVDSPVHAFYDKEGHLLDKDGNSIEDRSNIGEIIIADDVTSIAARAFYECDNLTNIKIPNSVTSIGEEAFKDCYKLTNINIPNSVTSIGKASFLRCPNLKTVYLENANTKYEDNTFPEHTKIIKKGTNESMKIRKNESIIKKAKGLLENNGYEVVKKNNLNEILSESDFIDPMRVIIAIKPKEDDDYHMQQAMNFFNKNIYTWKLGPEVLVDNSDGTYQLCFPGVDDWMNKIKLHCKESILDIQVESLI